MSGSRMPNTRTIAASSMRPSILSGRRLRLRRRHLLQLSVIFTVTLIVCSIRGLRISTSTYFACVKV